MSARPSVGRAVIEMAGERAASARRALAATRPHHRDRNQRTYMPNGHTRVVLTGPRRGVADHLRWVPSNIQSAQLALSELPSPDPNLNRRPEQP
ncbi:hypothetical protein [Pseudofrankia sp. BMG5.36]|uniref:hypothetical protein n=1 Tax=Pseudofrankia sp. BMG5.36 TaxID=1834512 RepID=UPI001042499D|nr:hypothetical protein [Pseudofrankia sp. BMG5.36]